MTMLDAQLAMPPIAWISPLPSEHTDIANYSARILPFLAAHTRVFAISSSHKTPHYKASHPNISIHHINDAADIIKNYSAIPFYNIGNNIHFHGSIIDICRHIPGVLILHDTRLQDLMCGYFQKNGGWPRKYTETMTSLYGKKGCKAATMVSTGKAAPHTISTDFPFVEYFSSNAQAAIIHNIDLFDEIISRLAIPVTYLDLPFPSIKLDGFSNIYDVNSDFKIFMFGFLGKNRGLNEALHAVAETPQAILDIHGAIDEREKFHQLVKSLGIEKRVTFHGFTEEHVLNAGIRGAHLVLNLRNPTMGEASGSQLRIWACGTPSVVVDHGWYATMPDGTAFKVNPHRILEGVHTAIRSIMHKPKCSVPMVEAGLAALKTRHDPARYAESIIQLIRQPQVYGGEWGAYFTASRMATLLDRERKMAALWDERILSVTQSLFRPSP